MSDMMVNNIEQIKRQQKDIEAMQSASAALLQVGALTPAQAQALNQLSEINKSLLKTAEDAANNTPSE